MKKKKKKSRITTKPQISLQVLLGGLIRKGGRGGAVGLAINHFFVRSMAASKKYWMGLHPALTGCRNSKVDASVVPPISRFWSPAQLEMEYSDLELIVILQ